SRSPGCPGAAAEPIAGAPEVASSRPARRADRLAPVTSAPADPLDFFATDRIEDPYPLYERLRARAPVHEIAGTGAFLVTTWKLVEEALTRHQDFSAQLTGILALGPGGRPELLDLTGRGTFTDSIANADEPEHSLHREIVQPAFAPARIAAFETE